MASKPKSKKQAAYQRYFEGYTEVPYTNERGVTKIRRIYTAPYWVHDMTDEAWKRHRAETGLSALAVLALYLTAALLPAPGMRWKLMFAISGLAAFCMLFTVTSAVIYLTEPRRMTIYDQKESSGAMRRWPFLTAMALGLAAVSSLVCAAMLRSAWTLVSGLAFAAAAALCWRMYRAEDRMEYCEEENENSFGDEGRMPF